MASVLSAFTPVASTTDGTTFATGSFTPVADDLLVVFVIASGTVAAAPTLTASANSLTFTLLSTKAVYQTSADTIYAFVGDQLVPGSPAAMTLTFTCSADAATGAIIAGAAVTGMTNVGTAAIRQAAKVDNVAGGTAPAATFGAAALTTNPTLWAIGQSVATGSTPPVGWTERADVNYATPTRGGGFASRDSGFTGTTITHGSGTNGLAAAIALELDATAAAAALPPIIVQPPRR